LATRPRRIGNRGKSGGLIGWRRLWYRRATAVGLTASPWIAWPATTPRDDTPLMVPWCNLHQTSILLWLSELTYFAPFVTKRCMEQKASTRNPRPGRCEADRIASGLATPPSGYELGPPGVQFCIDCHSYSRVGALRHPCRLLLRADRGSPNSTGRTGYGSPTCRSPSSLPVRILPLLLIATQLLVARITPSRPAPARAWPHRDADA
jgi:hypothetical protein